MPACHRERRRVARLGGGPLAAPPATGASALAGAAPDGPRRRPQPRRGDRRHRAEARRDREHRADVDHGRDRRAARGRGSTQPPGPREDRARFSYADSYVGSPIYTLRGVGFSDISLAAVRPSASISTKRRSRSRSRPAAPISTSNASRCSRGRKARCSARTPRAARSTTSPPSRPGRFRRGWSQLRQLQRHRLGGFVSGPITDTLTGAGSPRAHQNDDWQRSYTTGATNGLGDFTSGRVEPRLDPDATV